MTRKLTTIALLGMTTIPTLFALGCSSAEKPYSLTGTAERPVDQDHERWRQQMTYTDSKGHYHPELAAQGRALRPTPQ